ncbi:MAG TPA: sigma-70 family RNA polymerase sigma factor, partial [Lacipirellulaceae bacterium]|nr:sigma-70 family RNA polymerase sigma factor [Lacipirellulaceae bacterium]
MSIALDSSVSTAETDVALTAAALAGDRQAFGRIVERYQVLVSSIAYSAIGDVGRSEDLAQETFIVAWKNLASLAEPQKLKSWLCGIVRNLISNSRRREATNTAAHAQVIDTGADVAHKAAGPVEVAIRREEEALLWRVLADLPPNYREPLVLYHRGGQSVAEVADQLELSEEAVKQRLSRGRKVLKAEVAAHVEKILRATRPGPAFAAAVLAALPAAAPQAMAAGLAVAAKSASAKAAATGGAAFAGAILGPLLGLLGAAFGFMAAVTGARSPRERRFVRTFIVVVIVLVAALLAVQVIAFTYFRAAYQTVTFQIVLWSVYGVVLTFLILWGKRRGADIRRQDRREVPTNGSLGELGDVPLRSLNWSLAGMMCGASCWIAVAAIAANDWLLPTAAFAGLAIVWRRITRWLARSDTLPNRVLALLYGTLAACAADILVSTIRWSAWQAVPGHLAQRYSLWLVNVFIIVICLGVSI